MGVRGFTTYMSNHSHLFLERFKLRNCFLIIDGSGVAISLYNWHTKANDCFGGDYDKYANTVYIFFDLLKRCNVVPIILFDGGYENRKLKTVFSRMRNRVGAIKRVNSVTGNSLNIYPLFVKELFQDIAMHLGIKCIRNDYESDSEIACLARNLNCPILGYDSDFFFFDTLYIPFDRFDMKVLKERLYGEYIPCYVYSIDKFLNHFGGLNKSNLPLLPVLLGNDYIKKGVFSAFYKHIKLEKSKCSNEQQRLIKTIITWLRNETLESAISKILGRFRVDRRKLISQKLHDAMKGYLQVNSSLTEYLDDIAQSAISMKEGNSIDILKMGSVIEDTEINDESDEIESVDSTENEDDISDLVVEECSDISDHNEVEKIKNSLGENTYFIEKYRKCYLPQCFVDIKMRNIYFLLSLIEDYSERHSHSLTLNILRCIHKILTQPSTKCFVCVVRSDHAFLKKEVQPVYSENIPSFQEIQNLSQEQCKQYFFSILKINTRYLDFLSIFPSNWHLFLISLYFWKNNSESIIDASFVYALILCALMLNYVDPQIGSSRSSSAFYKNYSKHLLKLDNVKKDIPVTNILKTSLEYIDFSESLLCAKSLLNYFNMNPKMLSNSKMYDVSVVGKFSQFQSCFLHIKFLNSVFNFPVENALFSKFFNGTFLYNMTVNLSKRSNLQDYISTLMKESKAVLCSFKIILEHVDMYLGKIDERGAKKRRKRKRNQKKERTIEREPIILEEEKFLDTENCYSLLQYVDIS